MKSHLLLLHMEQAESCLKCWLASSSSPLSLCLSVSPFNSVLFIPSVYLLDNLSPSFFLSSSFVFAHLLDELILKTKNSLFFKDVYMFLNCCNTHLSKDNFIQSWNEVSAAAKVTGFRGRTDSDLENTVKIRWNEKEYKCRDTSAWF